MERLGRVLDPCRELGGVNRVLRRVALPSPADFPAVNIWVTEDSAVVTTEVPGIDPNGLEISVVKDSLTLRGTLPADELKEGESYHRRLLDRLDEALAPGGVALLEIGSNQGPAVIRAIEERQPRWSVRIEPDLGGAPRVARIDRPDVAQGGR